MLTLVLIILFVAALIGFSHGLFSSHVISHTQRASLGSVCRYVAESACEEALYVVQQAVNRPGTQMFEDFRGKVFGEGPDPFEVSSVTPGGLPHTCSILEALPRSAGYGLERVQVRVLFRRPLTNLSYETFGTLHIEATAFCGLMPNIRRTVAVSRDFKVALVSPPRPFGKLAFLAGSAKGLIREDNPNGVIKPCYRQIHLIWKQMKKAKETIEANALATPAHKKKAKKALEEVVRAAGPLLVGADGSATVSPYDWKDNPQPRREDEGGPHYFGDPSVRGEAEIAQANDLMILVSGETEVLDLGKLDLITILEPLEQARAQADTAFLNELGRLERAGRVSEKDFEKLRKLALASVATNRAVLEACLEFQVLVGEKAGESKEHWDENFILKKLTLLDWKDKAFFRVTSQDSLDSLLAEVNPLSGIVYVDTREPVSLSNIQHKGKLILVFPGAVCLQNIQVEDPRVDQLTFVCFKHLKVDGTIQASLILGYQLPAPKLEIGENFTLHGNLICASHLDVGGGVLRGTIRYDETLHSGDTTVDERMGHFFVALSPCIRSKVVRRR